MSEITYANGKTSFVAEGAVEMGDALMLGTAYPQAKKTTGDTVYVVGVALAAAATGEAVLVALNGTVVTCRSSAAVTAGSAVAAAADGEIQDAASADQAIGVALEAATAADADVPVLMGCVGWLLA